MRPFVHVLQQLGKALEFSNHVGSPTALHQLLAQQALQARAATLASVEDVAHLSQPAAKANTATTELPRLVCVR
jgi:hypothetical protein